MSTETEQSVCDKLENLTILAAVFFLVWLTGSGWWVLLLLAFFLA